MKKNNSKNVDKQKIKRICLSILHVFCYICTFLFWVILIIGLTSKSSNVSTKSHRTRAIVPSNDNQTVTVSVDDIISLRFYGLGLNDDDVIRFVNSYVLDVGDSFNFFYDDFVSEYVYIGGSEYNAFLITYIFSESEDDIYLLQWAYVIDLDFIYFDSVNSSDISSFGSLSFSSDVSSNGYNPYFFDLYFGYLYGEPNSDIFSDISDSTVGFIDTISEGLDSTFDIFYDDGITTIGYLTCIVVAVALGYFSLRLIMGLIRLRGC